MEKKRTFRGACLQIRKKWRVYLMMVPGIVWAILFCYIPMYGIIIAFKEYSPVLGYMGSPWVGFKHFRELFRSDFARIMRNTLLISVGSFITGTPCPILFALLVTDLKNKFVRRTVQTLSYVPYFVSTVVVSSMCYIFFAPNTGYLNVLLRRVGLIEKSLGFLENGPMFIVMLLLVNIWKNTGFSAIIYFAAIAGIDPALYEAATIDGAKSYQMKWYITLPSIMPTILVLTVLALSGLLNAGFEQQMIMANNMVWKWADVLDTYSYRYGLKQLRYSYGAAVGLFKSVVALCMLLISNGVMKRITGYSLYK